MNKILIIVMIFVLALLAGCNSQPKLWGNGDPPKEYQGWFGNSNNARQDFYQNKKLNRHDIMIFGLDKTDEAGQVVHEPGIIDYLKYFDDEIDKLKAVSADPNGK